MKTRLTPKTKPTPKGKSDSQTQVAAAKRPRAREFTEQEKKSIVQAAMENLKNGKSISSFCTANGLAFSTVYDWASQEEYGGNSALAQARMVGTEALADKLLDELENATNDNVTIVKTRVDSIIRLIGKWNPKAYGDRQEIDVNHNMPDFGAMSPERRAEFRRLLSEPDVRALSAPPVTIVQDPE